MSSNLFILLLLLGLASATKFVKPKSNPKTDAEFLKYVQELTADFEKHKKDCEYLKTFVESANKEDFDKPRNDGTSSLGLGLLKSYYVNVFSDLEQLAAASKCPKLPLKSG